MSIRSKKPTTAKDYEKLGRMLEAIFQTEYLERKVMYKMSFVKGLVTGLGGVLGATILVALLLWVLSFFNQIPLIGPIFDNLQNTIETQKTNLP